MTNEAEQEIETPCVGVCTMNETTGFCLGCYRNVEEIQNWWDKSNAEKSAILVQLEARISNSFD
ncbi:MAG: DUF1289 domain-containing protein [Methylophilaceae bacterium]